VTSRRYWRPRTGHECVFMPSGRFAIHLAFQLRLSPGDRILMSPLEDDTVFFGALAAGLRPVMAPMSAHDGNIRIDAIDDETWSTLPPFSQLTHTVFPTLS